MSETRVFARSGLDQAILAAVALGALAAAAWALLASGVVDHTSHDVVLGSGQSPRPGGLL